MPVVTLFTGIAYNNNPPPGGNVPNKYLPLLGVGLIPMLSALPMLILLVGAFGL